MAGAGSKAAGGQSAGLTAPPSQADSAPGLRRTGGEMALNISARGKTITELQLDHTSHTLPNIY